MTKAHSVTVQGTGAYLKNYYGNSKNQSDRETKTERENADGDREKEEEAWGKGDEERPKSSKPC